MSAPSELASVLAGTGAAFAAGRDAGRSLALAEAGTVLAEVAGYAADLAGVMFLDGLDRDGVFVDEDERAEWARCARAYFAGKFAQAVADRTALR